MPRLLACLFLFCAFATTTPILAASPTVDHIFPAGGQRGTTVNVSITGKLDGKTKAWCSCDSAKLSLNAKSKKLQVVIPPDAKPGLHWIRLFNDDGASPPKAFLIGTLPELVEKEPNDKIEQSQTLSSSAVINGVLAKSNEVDTFAISLKKGQTLVASMTANNTLGSPMDGILQVVSPRGFVLEQNDDTHGFDPQLTYVAKEDETVHVRAFAFPAMPNSSVRLSGASNYIYRLTVTTGPFVDHAFPLAVSGKQTATVQLHGWNIPEDLKSLTVPADGSQTSAKLDHSHIANVANVGIVSHAVLTEREPNSGDHSQTVTLPVTISGHIDRPRDVDVFRFAAKKSDNLRFRIEARTLGSPLDPVLRVLDAKGAVVAQAETRSSKDIDETLSYRVPADGDYRLEVADLHRRGGWRFAYRLTMSASPLLESLSVSADRYTLTPGKPLVIPVTIAGTGISADDLKIEVRGLPAGITVATSAGTNSGKTRSKGRGRGRRGSRSGGQTMQVTLTAKSAAAFNGPIQIVAVEDGEPRREHFASAAGVDASARIHAIWLTVAKSSGKKASKKKP